MKKALSVIGAIITVVCCTAALSSCVPDILCGGYWTADIENLEYLSAVLGENFILPSNDSGISDISVGSSTKRDTYKKKYYSDISAAYFRYAVDGRVTYVTVSKGASDYEYCIGQHEFTAVTTASGKRVELREKLCVDTSMKSARYAAEFFYRGSGYAFITNIKTDVTDFVGYDNFIKSDSVKAQETSARMNIEEFIKGFKKY